MRAKPVPKGLGPAGAAFWNALQRRVDLDVTQEAVLELACRQLDVAQRFRSDDGDLRTVEAERRATLAFQRLIKDLHLDTARKPERRETPTVASDDPRSVL